MNDYDYENLNCPICDFPSLVDGECTYDECQSNQ